MRNETRRGAARGILAAAAISAMVGATSARGDFIVTMTKTTVGGDDVYVLAAQNDGTLSSGTALDGTDTTVSATSPMVVDTVDDVNGDGYADANVGGYADQSFGNPRPSFGSNLGNFVGDASGQNKFVTSGVNAVFVNSNVNAVGAPQAVWETSANPVSPYNQVPPYIDSNFTNGTVTALEVVSSSSSGGTLASNKAIDFANIVVPTGTPIVFHGLLGGDTGNEFSFVGTSSNGLLPSIGPIGIVGQNAGSATVSNGQNGLKPSTITVSSPSQTSGFITVKGFTSGENQVYALTITGENSLSQLISDINEAVGIEDPGATASAPTPDIASLFPTATVEVVIPSPTGLTVSETSDFSFDFDSYVSNNDGPPLISSIGVIPEPASLALIGFGGATLLARRRRKA